MTTIPALSSGTSLTKPENWKWWEWTGITILFSAIPYKRRGVPCFTNRPGRKANRQRGRAGPDRGASGG